MQAPVAAVKLEHFSRTEATHKEIATEEGQATWETEATAGTNAVDGKVTLYTT